MKNDFIEEWKDINGYEGYFMVSNLGRVYSIPRKYIANNAICSAGGNIVTISTNKFRGDRRSVTLCANMNKCKRYVSDLVGEAFIPNPYAKTEVDHILPIRDGGGDEVFNLRWVTRKENMANKMTKELVDNNRPKIKVAQYKKNGELVAVFNSEAQAEKETGIRRQNIDSCCKNKPKYKTAGGYIWKFV